MATLDLYITAAPDSAAAARLPTMFFGANNGNSTFTDVSVETALGFAATGAGLSALTLTTTGQLTSSSCGGQAGASILSQSARREIHAVGGIDFNKEKLPPAVGVVGSTSIKTAGWIWRSRMRARRVSASGGM